MLFKEQTYQVHKFQVKENEWCLDPLFFSNFFNRIHNMALMVTRHVSAHRVYRASQEARDPRDQLVQRDHPGITDPKDLWVHEESKAMKDPVENRDFQAPREVQGQLVQQAQVETRVMQAPWKSRSSWPQGTTRPLGSSWKEGWYRSSWKSRSLRP